MSAISGTSKFHSALQSYLEEVVRDHNVVSGDRIHLSIDLAVLGRCLRVLSSDAEEVTSTALSFFRNHLGPKGTLLISCFSFDFSNFGAFSAAHSSVETGSFSKILFQQRPEARTLGPIYSFLAFGAEASKAFEARRNSTGADSVFAMMIDSNYKMLSIGHHVATAFTIAHYFEQLARVEYRYLKKIIGKLTLKDGTDSPWTTYLYVRGKGCEFSGLTSGGFQKLLKNKAALAFVHQVKHDRIASFTVDLRAASVLIQEDFDSGGRNYIRPRMSEGKITGDMEPMSREISMDAYLSLISLGH
jgi:aminoglycoside N3'-acetyltransferase